jgi:osmoprotectant transport system substrate-binding protein
VPSIPEEKSIRMKRMNAVPAMAAAVAVLCLAACGAGSDPTRPAAGAGADNTTIRIGSADFSESKLIGEIYAGALEAKGVKVVKTFDIGSRERYLKALQDGSIDLIAEYTGSLSTFLNKNASAKDSAGVYAELKAALPASLTVLDKSAAEDKDSIAVTKAAAAQWSLKTISDLAAHQNEVTIAAPPEFKTRERGLVGLKSQYGVDLTSRFVPLKGKAVVEAMKNGQAQAGNIFSTDPAISKESFVVLDDPKALFGVDNVVPLITKAKVTPTVSAALNAVSAKLDTPTLGDLLKQVVSDTKDPAVVAKEFLTKNGLS